MSGKVGRDHPETAKQAARLVKEGSQQAAILDILQDFGPMTAAEITPWLNSYLNRSSISRNQCATRILELREKGKVTALLDDQGEVVTRTTEGANKGIVWTLMPRLVRVQVK